MGQPQAQDWLDCSLSIFVARGMAAWIQNPQHGERQERASSLNAKSPRTWQISDILTILLANLFESNTEK
jgi:hypothetical protein